MEACEAVKIDYEERKRLAIQQNAAKEKREELLEAEKERVGENYKLMKDRLDQSVKVYEKAMDSDSSLAAKFLGNSIEGAIKIASTIPLMISKASPVGCIATTSTSVLTPIPAIFQTEQQQASSDSSQSEKTEEKNKKNQVKRYSTHEDKKIVAELPCLRKYVDDLKKQADLLCNDKKQSLDHNLIGISRAAIIEIASHLKEHKGRHQDRLHKVKDTSVELANMIESNVKQMRSDVDKDKVASLKVEIEASLSAIESYYAYSGATSALQRARNMDRNAKNKRSALEKQSENFQHKLEIARQTLEGARSELRYANPSIQKNNEKMAQVIAELAKVGIDEIEIDQIEEILRKSLSALRELKEKWGKLILFFLSVSLSININSFVVDSTYLLEKAHEQDLKDFHGEILRTSAINANHLAFVAHNMSVNYLDISKKHIMDRLASLERLVALDAKKDSKEINRMQETLSKNSLAACEDIKKRVQGREAGLAEHHNNESLNRIINEFKKSHNRPFKHPLAEAEGKKATEKARENRQAQLGEDDYA